MPLVLALWDLVNSSSAHPLPSWFCKFWSFPSHLDHSPPTPHPHSSPNQRLASLSLQDSSLSWLCPFRDVETRIIHRDVSTLKFYTMIKLYSLSCTNIPADAQHFASFFDCHNSWSWWVQRTVNDDSEVSLLCCTCQFWAQLCIGSWDYFSTFTFIYMEALLPAFQPFIQFSDVILDFPTIGTTFGNPREYSNGKLGDLPVHSLFQVTNDNVEQNVSQHQSLGDDTTNSSPSWKVRIIPYPLITILLPDFNL